MCWEFTEMSRSTADAIAAWRYEEPYGFYDMTSDAEDLADFLDESSWRIGDLGQRDIVIAVNTNAELAGFFSFAGAPDLCTIGLGLAPQLTGRSLGQGFVAAGLSFARDRWAVEKFRLEVASLISARSRCTSDSDSPVNEYWSGSPVGSASSSSK